MSGFSAVLGNPPFLGGTKISSYYGDPILAFIKNSFRNTGNRCDLVAYFIQTMYLSAKSNGSCGFIGPDSIAEGDTRRGSLLELIRQGGCISHAIKRVPWLGDAAVMVAIVSVTKDCIIKPATLNGKKIDRISAMLREGNVDDVPKKLAMNNNTFCKGYEPYSSGFLFDSNDSKANSLDKLNDIRRYHPNEMIHVKPYLTGREVNNSSDFVSNRFIINFGNVSEEEAMRSPNLFNLLTEKVKPERDLNPKIFSNKPYWHYHRTRPILLEFQKENDFVIVNSMVTKHLNFVILPSDTVFSAALMIHLQSKISHFGILQSYIHEAWVRFCCSTMKGDLRYTSDGLETFPFLPCDEATDIANEYYQYRSKLLKESKIGLTELYNRFHSSMVTEDLTKLRFLQKTLDEAIAESYGMNDLDFTRTYRETEVGLRFVPSRETESAVINRIFKLNQRFT